MEKKELLVAMLANADEWEIRKVMRSIMVTGFDLKIQIEQSENDENMFDIIINDEKASQIGYRMENNVIWPESIATLTAYMASLNRSVFTKQMMLNVLKKIAFNEIESLAHTMGATVLACPFQTRFHAMEKVTADYVDSVYGEVVQKLFAA